MDLSNPDINCKKWYVVEKIPLLFHSLLKTKGPSLIPREKTRIFSKFVVLQTEFPVANAIHPVIQPHHADQFYPICFRRASA